MGESIINVTPWKINGWNLKVTKFEKKNHLNQTSMSWGFKMFIFQGRCTPLFHNGLNTSSPWLRICPCLFCFFFHQDFMRPYLEDHSRTCKQVVNNYGDRFRPLRIGLWDPFQMALLWLINGGVFNDLLNGMILQVLAGIGALIS